MTNPGAALFRGRRPNLLITRKFLEQEGEVEVDTPVFRRPRLPDAMVADGQSHGSNERHSGWTGKGLILSHAHIRTSARGPDANHL